MKAEPVGRLEDLALLDAQMRPRAIVGRVAVGHDGIQAVVTACEFDDDQNAFGMFLDAGALECLRGERR